ncbi:hypothetical protein PRIPAC_77164 [Pristionchus pacificus]|uniref:Uncharacterized protein n=1 Tax=Pristionchus pacificus TaxID=54126 RepID=A0A2A6CJI0_PRIPA|nr:hypothetical protein PRIPAC_77164 [Pristionchus pacificus]|eukprot:PDM78384.1 hypothetical protein PRIPAC_30963 [Pristionchus pacificus]
MERSFNDPTDKGQSHILTSSYSSAACANLVGLYCVGPVIPLIALVFAIRRKILAKLDEQKDFMAGVDEIDMTASNSSLWNF